MFFSGFLLACATPETGADEGPFEAESRRSDCISSGTVRDYEVLDDANLVVTAGAKRRYHVELSRRAIGLRGSWQIGFRSTTGSICGGFDELLVDGGLGPQAYRISRIQEVSPEDYENLLVRFGKKEPDVKQTPPSRKVEGAEVEELD